MNAPDALLEIQTLGRLSISIDGKFITADWPNESLKELFCSLLSPLDLYISWDRIYRSMWDIPASANSSHQMEKMFIRPLKNFLVKTLGINPLITGDDGIRIDQSLVRLDALEFHSAAVGGLRLLSLDNHAAAREKFSRAKALYAGSYLPGISGRIIANTRNKLESLYLTAVLDAMPLTRSPRWLGCERRAKPELYIKSSRRPFQTKDDMYELPELTTLHKTVHSG